MSRYESCDLGRIKTYSIRKRRHRVAARSLATVPRPASLSSWLSGLPDQLAGRDFKSFIRAWETARSRQRARLVFLGAHVVKCGLGPIIIDLIRRRYITHVAVNGALPVHDLELALFGATSEDVSANLKTGRFGMVRETATIINSIASLAAVTGLGLGEAIGKYLMEEKAPLRRHSILAQAYQAGVPVTVHVALGTDTIHQHPEADGSALGETSLLDFRILINSLTKLDDGLAAGFGSAVILPEVFLKALSVARNLGFGRGAFTTAYFDMIRQYRPQENIVRRPTEPFGRGYYFAGHHEIMLPLISACLKR
jgi:hypothetical protein